MMLFAIPFTAFAVFWICGASGFKAPSLHGGAGLFPLFGIPFLSVGLAMLSSPFWAMRAARKTGYFITQSRAILIEKRFFSGYKIRMFYPENLREIERIQLSDGSGDIILAREIRNASSSNTGNQMIQIGFFGIAEVREVERRLVELSRKAVEEMRS